MAYRRPGAREGPFPFIRRSGGRCRRPSPAHLGGSRPGSSALAFSGSWGAGAGSFRGADLPCGRAQVAPLRPHCVPKPALSRSEEPGLPLGSWVLLAWGLWEGGGYKFLGRGVILGAGLSVPPRLSQDGRVRGILPGQDGIGDAAGTRHSRKRRRLLGRPGASEGHRRQ